MYITIFLLLLPNHSSYVEIHIPAVSIFPLSSDSDLKSLPEMLNDTYQL